MKKYITHVTLVTFPNSSNRVMSIVINSNSFDNARISITKIIRNDEFYDDKEIKSIELFEVSDSSKINLCEIYPDNNGCEYDNIFKWDEMD